MPEKNGGLTAAQTLEELDDPYYSVYLDRRRLKDFTDDGGIFEGMDIYNALDTIVARALEIGLDPSQINEFRKNSDLYETTGDSLKDAMIYLAHAHGENALSSEDLNIARNIADKKKLTADDRRTARKVARKYKELLPMNIYAGILEYGVEEEERLPDISIAISEEDQVFGKVWNGREGKICYVTKSKKGDTVITVLIRWNGAILGVILLDGTKPAIHYRYNDIEYVQTLDDFLVFMKQHFSLTLNYAQKLREIFDAYTGEMIQTHQYSEKGFSPVYVKNGTITIESPDLDLKDIMRKLREYHDYATKPEAFSTVFAYTLLAPLHYYFKNHSVSGVQTPLLLMSGKTGMGKTPLGYIFIGKGYDMPSKKYYFGLNSVVKVYTLTHYLSTTNIPLLIDDVPMSWIVQNKENLKTYVQTGLFATRGRPDQTIKTYSGMASFIMTMNEDFVMDADPAFSNRLVILYFSEDGASRVDRDRYLKFMETMPNGFMLAIANKLLGGQKLETLLSTVETFKTGKEWIRFALHMINSLCTELGIDPFPEGDMPATEGKSSYVMDVIDMMMSEYDKMMAMDRPTNSYLYGNIDIVDYGQRKYVHFTGIALQKTLKMMGSEVPYKTAREFINAVIQRNPSGIRVEDNGNTRSIRIPGRAYPIKMFTVSLPLPSDNG